MSLLELPWELVDMIVESLSVSDRVALSGTCRAFRARYWKPKLRLSLNTYCRSIEGIRWLMEHPEQWSRWKGRVCRWAECSLDLRVLKFAREQGCPWEFPTELDDDDIDENGEEAVVVGQKAAEAGDLEILKWIRDNGYRFNRFFDRLVCRAAAKGGHLEIIMWLMEQGSPWDRGVCDSAARGGHLEVLKWLHYHGCPWGTTTCAAAAGVN